MNTAEKWTHTSCLHKMNYKISFIKTVINHFCKISSKDSGNWRNRKVYVHVFPSTFKSICVHGLYIYNIVCAIFQALAEHQFPLLDLRSVCRKWLLFSIYSNVTAIFITKILFFLGYLIWFFKMFIRDKKNHFLKNFKHFPGYRILRFRFHE